MSIMRKKEREKRKCEGVQGRIFFCSSTLFTSRIEKREEKHCKILYNMCTVRGILDCVHP